MNTKEKWFNIPVLDIVHLDILVIRIKDHEDWRYILLQVLHHGQRHSFHQVVPSIWDHIPEKGWVGTNNKIMETSYTYKFDSEALLFSWLSSTMVTWP